MGMDPFSLALIGMAVGTAVSVVGGMEQGKAQRRAERTQQRLEQIKTQRQVTAQVRESRIKRGAIAQQGQNAGAGGSSAVVGGEQGVQAQANQNIGFIGRQADAGRSMSAARQDMMDAQGISAIGGGISDISGTVFANREEITDIFGKRNATG